MSTKEQVLMRLLRLAGFEQPIQQGFNEEEFQRWYAQQAKRWGLNPNPDDPRHFYDYRAAFLAGASPDEQGHWPSEFKRQGHPNLIVGGVDTRTGRPEKK